MKQLAECLPHNGGSVNGCDNDDGDDNGDDGDDDGDDGDDDVLACAKSLQSCPTL